MAKTKKAESETTGVPVNVVKQLAEDVVRQAISEQARNLEKHLTDIHNRLVELEKRRQ